MPSPAWNTLPMRRPDRARRARGCGRAPRAASCAARRRPARSSSARRGPSPQTPPCAPSRCAPRCASSCATSTVVAPGASADRLDDGEELRALRPTARRARRSGSCRPAGSSGCTAASAASIASASIISTAAGTMPAAMISDTAAPASLMLSNAASSVCTLSGLRRIRTTTFVTIGERAFAADEQPEQVGAGRVGERAADLHELAVRQHRFDREDVVHGEAVLQAVRAAGVLGDVAADRAHLLTRRVGGVVVAERRHLPRDLEVGDARFDGDAPVRDVDVEHAIQPRQADDDAARHRQRAARETRCRGRAPRTARPPCRRCARSPAPRPPIEAARRAPGVCAGAAARRTRR